MNYVHPEYLIEVEQLHALLEDENVRIFDASVLLHRVKTATPQSQALRLI